MERLVVTPLPMFIKLRTVKFVKHIVLQNKYKPCQIAYEYENSVVNSNSQMKQRPDICYFLSDTETNFLYMMNCLTRWTF